MFDVVVEAQSGLSIARREVEYVERKGLGHPDTICDLVMESVSQSLSRHYLEVAGEVLHHNLDKGLLVAGVSQPKLGGGTIDSPMRLILGDRATMQWHGKRLPVAEICSTTVERWFRQHLRFVRPSEHLIIQNELRPGSAELVSIFQAPRPGCLAANDTSAAVGFAPLTETEHLVLSAEHFLNSAEFKHAFPETGEDVKVMGFRRGRQLHLTVAMAFVDHFIWEEATYFHRKELARQKLQSYLETKLHELDGLDIRINALDRPGSGLDGMYLTVLGTSAESADGGEVGRGNRVHGLISFCRPSSLEAAAGKNPVSHVGKIYNLFAHQVAATIHQTIEPVEEATIWLCSQIGMPLDQPWSVAVQVSLTPGVGIADVAKPIRELVRRELMEMPTFTKRVTAGDLPIC